MTAREIIDTRGVYAIKARWAVNQSQAAMARWLGCNRGTVRHLIELLNLRRNDDTAGRPPPQYEDEESEASCSAISNDSPGEPDEPRITTGNEQEIDGGKVLAAQSATCPRPASAQGSSLPPSRAPLPY